MQVSWRAGRGVVLFLPSSRLFPLVPCPFRSTVVSDYAPLVPCVTFSSSLWLDCTLLRCSTASPPNALTRNPVLIYHLLSVTNRGASVLRNETAVDAVELFDRASLRECEADEGMARLVPDIRGADPMAAALLIECRG